MQMFFTDASPNFAGKAPPTSRQFKLDAWINTRGQGGNQVLLQLKKNLWQQLYGNLCDWMQAKQIPGSVAKQCCSNKSMNDWHTHKDLKRANGGTTASKTMASHSGPDWTNWGWHTMQGLCITRMSISWGITTLDEEIKVPTEIKAEKWARDVPSSSLCCTYHNLHCENGWLHCLLQAFCLIAIHRQPCRRGFYSVLHCCAGACLLPPQPKLAQPLWCAGSVKDLPAPPRGWPQGHWISALQLLPLFLSQKDSVYALALS